MQIEATNRRQDRLITLDWDTPAERLRDLLRTT
jgi:hypothetical protein